MRMEFSVHTRASDWHRAPRVPGPGADLRRGASAAILSSYAAYYNEVRTHLALGKDAPAGRAVQRSGAIVAIPILSGLHHHYVRIPFSERTRFLVGDFTICASNDREPFPIGIFVSSLAKVGIAFKARPSPVTGHAPYLRDAETRLEQSRNAIMAQVMEV